MLNAEEKSRYHRHLILQGFGEVAQEKLKRASVLVIGAGGLSCPALLYLTAAGVGRIGIMDDDRVEISNLQRQILFSSESVGRNKAQAAAEELRKRNPFIELAPIPERLTTKNALKLFGEFDIILDGTDNFSSRYLINDAAVLSRKPVVYGSIFKFEGQLSVFNYQNGATYRCLFPDPPAAGTVPNCAEIGVIGVLPGIIGTQQANEVIKIITGIGEPCSGKLVLYNSLKAEYTSVTISRNDDAVEKVRNNASLFEQMDYALFCGETSTNPRYEIDLVEFKRLLADGHITVLDVREPSELPELSYPKKIQISLRILPENTSKIPSLEQVVVICQSGKRSLAALRLLKDEYNFRNLVSLKGGIGQYV